MKFWTVDAFATKPFTGNPAAVVIVDDFSDDTQCQYIAAEFNLSETAFVKPLDNDSFHIRWFTPSVEVKLCGHATLAAAHILYQEQYTQTPKIQLDSLSGSLTVTQEEAGQLTLDFPLQATGPALPKHSFETLFKQTIIAVTQALDDIIVELEHADQISTLSVDMQQLQHVDCRAVIVTAQSDTPYDFISRVFAPRVGVPEDPVTGSAHCKLADYWSRKLDKSVLRAYQASKRGGVLDLLVQGDRVLITGTAITMIQGELVNL